MKRSGNSTNGSGRGTCRVDRTIRVPQNRQMDINRKLPPLWVLNLIGWGAFGVLMFGFRLLIHMDLDRALGITAAQEPTAIFLSWLLFLFYRRLEAGGGFRVQTAAWMVLLSLPAAFLQAVVAIACVNYFGWHHSTWTLFEEWLLRVLFYLVVFLSWSLAYFWLRAEQASVHHETMATLAQEEAAKLEMKLLRAQLDPHFLFNALNGLATLILSRPQDAVAMVRELADYLRYSLDHRHESIVSLEEELEAVASYLHIEKLRFGDRLHIRLEADPTARKAKVPSFLLQPLAENAVKHCFRHDQPPWELEMQAEAHNGTLCLSVRNSGHLANGAKAGFGMGWETLQRRLELYYPGRHEVRLTQEEECVLAKIQLEGQPRCE